MTRDTAAKRLKKMLTASVPGATFSVTGNKYIDGHSLEIKWSGNVIAGDVATIAADFEGFGLFEAFGQRVRLWKPRTRDITISAQVSA